MRSGLLQIMNKGKAFNRFLLHSVRDFNADIELGSAALGGAFVCLARI